MWRVVLRILLCTITVLQRIISSSPLCPELHPHEWITDPVETFLLHTNDFVFKTTMKIIALVSAFVLLAPCISANGAASSVTLIQSAETIPSKDHPDRLAKYQYNVSDTKKSGRMTLEVDLGTKFQTIKGFGGAFTDSVAHVFSQLKPELQEEVVEAWGASGQQYNLARLTIGGTDFSVDVYNYNENPNDFDQSKFSIKHDEDKIIPLI